MAVRRIKTKKRNFTCVDNGFIDDERLSLGAIGLMLSVAELSMLVFNDLTASNERRLTLQCQQFTGRNHRLEQRCEQLQQERDAALDEVEALSDTLESQSDTILMLEEKVSKHEKAIEQLNAWIEVLEKSPVHNLYFKDVPFGGSTQRVFLPAPSDTDKERSIRYYRQQNAYLKMRLSQRGEIIEKLHNGESSATLSMS